jgi:hypothetical protein
MLACGSGASGVHAALLAIHHNANRRLVGNPSDMVGQSGRFGGGGGGLMMMHVLLIHAHTYYASIYYINMCF